MGTRKKKPAVKWNIRVPRSALDMLGAIRDKRVRSSLVAAIDGLSSNPERQGKPLVGILAGYRSLQAVGQRYRILYRIEQEKVVVYVVAVGIRKDGDNKDIYELARKLASDYKNRI